MSIIEKKEKNLNQLINKLNSLTLTYSQPNYEVEKIKTENCLAVVTDGPNVACGINNEGVAKVRPEVINSTLSRLGAGDAFFAYFLSHKELNPKVSLEKSLNVANKKTKQYLEAND